MTQCRFGEQLLKKYPYKTVGGLVEAEKSVLICSVLMLQLVWGVVGGNGQLGDKMDVFHRRTIVAFPDSDAHDKWVEKINERPTLTSRFRRYCVSTRLP